MSGGVGRICECNARAQYVPCVLTGELAAVHFRDGLDVEAIDVAKFVDVPAPPRPDMLIGVQPAAPAMMRL
jgi:hypothetical protein